MLIELSKALEKCGSLFLAAALVEEAYGRECMEEIAFGRGDLDTAAVKLAERLRRQLVPPPARGGDEANGMLKRGRRRPIARVAELLKRVEMKTQGAEVPDARRRAKAAA